MWVLVGGRRRELQRTPRRPIVRCNRCNMANDRRWENYRRSALFVQQQAPCWPMCVRECGLCQPAMHMWDMRSCMISYSDSLRPSAPLIDGKCCTASPHTRNQRLIANMSNRVYPASSVTWSDWCLLSTVGGALGETVATISLRTEKMLCMFRLLNKKCSATGPYRRCSGPEQYQKRFQYDL